MQELMAVDTCGWVHVLLVTASVSELSGLVTHTAVPSPQCNSEKRRLSNSVTFRTLFKQQTYCGILKINIIRKINTSIRCEPVYRPALESTLRNLLPDQFSFLTAQWKQWRWALRPAFQIFSRNWLRFTVNSHVKIKSLLIGKTDSTLRARKRLFPSMN